ncbi:MAG: hypothetical protein IT349_16620 [Candidatus Eisenbacteria bacterium]|nr:hypothetical protein [Candidatus Eisenbacteria bacterium]MCC7143725.1 hypothetical protein [Candidatus Eisenbacteria bacterium]
MKRIEIGNHALAALAVTAACMLWACSGGSKDSSAEHGAKTEAPAANPPASTPPVAQTQNPPPATPAPATETPRPKVDEGAKEDDHRDKPHADDVKKTPPSDTPKAPEREAFITKVVTVPSGTALHICLQQELSTEREAAGQAFDATTKGDIVIEGAKVIPEGSTVKGQVTLARRAPRVGGKAQLALEVNQLITPDGKTHRLFAEPLQLEGESATSSDVQKVVGGTVGGAIIGGLLGGKKGAVKGGAGGAAVGGVWAVATRGNDIVLEPNQEMEFHLAREISVTAQVPTQPLP